MKAAAGIWTALFISRHYSTLRSEIRCSLSYLNLFLKLLQRPLWTPRPVRRMEAPNPERLRRLLSLVSTNARPLLPLKIQKMRISLPQLQLSCFHILLMDRFQEPKTQNLCRPRDQRRVPLMMLQRYYNNLQR